MNTPVLFCIFNRLDIVEKTFEPIRRAKPKRLYIAADGARKEKCGEDVLTEQVRNYVINRIDWDCEVKTLFRNENLGCDVAISEALEWFFSNEEEGIVIEDDVLTSPQFFDFCELMLDTYRDNPKVRYIAGFIRIPAENMPESYYFVPKANTRGWAAWRRSFFPENGVAYKYHKSNYYEKQANTNEVLNQVLTTKKLKKCLTKCAYEFFFRVNQWDLEFYTYGMVYNPNSLSIAPSKTLTSHIGDYGFHFTGSDNPWNLPISDYDISKLEIKENITVDSDINEKIILDDFFGRYYKKYGNENIDIKAVKSDYYREKYRFVKSFFMFLYYKFIKFSNLKAKNQWNAFLELLKNPEIKTFEAFYIYATMCYKNKTK